MIIEQKNAKLPGGEEFFEKYGLNWNEVLPLAEDKISHNTCVTLSDKATNRKVVQHWENS